MSKAPFIVLGFIVIVLAVTMTSPTYTGHVINVKDTEYLLDNLDEVKEDYNANIDNVPGFFKALFGNEIIKLNIAMDDGTTEILYIKTEKGKINYINENKEENFTLDVWADEQTIDTISASEDQIMEISNALKNKKIKYEATTFKTKVKTKVAGVAFKVWNLFN